MFYRIWEIKKGVCFRPGIGVDTPQPMVDWREGLARSRNGKPGPEPQAKGDAKEGLGWGKVLGSEFKVLGCVSFV
ncbi:hypothetical protein DMA11_21845 [Marinilabiliaceae bacterium JC017]|nr:hypothetical protein DMA11_21845 [Marinilabiliaceae bacterium JC017]